MSLKRGDVIGGRFEVTSDGPIATYVLGRDPRCKSMLCGGSHYHCCRCGAVTSMMGHDAEGCKLAREQGRDDPEWVE